MTFFRPLSLILSLATPLHAESEQELLKLPLRVHLVTGVNMIREFTSEKGKVYKTVMNTPLTVKSTQPIMDQVNDIWAPSGIEWVTDPAQGGGGIVSEKAGGGKLSKERLDKLATLVVNRSREIRGRHMELVFPALADPANNESIKDDGRFASKKPEMYHLYLFPYVGQTLQGTAHCPGTFAIVGAFSDKRPNEKGHPKRRPDLIPGKGKLALSARNFPEAGALSATIAHELGHNLSLVHKADDMEDNLMKGHVKIRLSPRQTAKARKQALKGALIGKKDRSKVD